MSSSTTGPVRLAIVNDFEIVVAGVASMLAGHRDRVVVVELDSRVPVLADVDVVLWDTFAQVVGDGVDLGHLTRSGAKVVAYTWSAHPDSVARAMAQGVAGFLSKGLTAVQLMDALEAIHGGEVVTSPDLERGNAFGNGDWPGRHAGLSPRESEMLGFIVKGLSNQEIAEAAYLSINSVKTYVRTTYRKIGATRREHAVIWGLRHGFAPRSTRVVGASAVLADGDAAAQPTVHRTATAATAPTTAAP